MNITNAQFLISAAKKEQWPQTTHREFVFVGRSNVGKSSFINCVCNRKKLAYVGNTPGKTRLLNFFEINEEVMFVDVPGYGYANTSKKMLLEFGEMMEDYFAYRKQLKAMVVLVDARHKPTQDDLLMVDFARHFQIPILVIATKIDKVSKSKRHSQIQMIKNTLKIESIIPFSIITKQGKEEFYNQIESFL